jgi:hypothetical protein
MSQPKSETLQLVCRDIVAPMRWRFVYSPCIPGRLHAIHVFGAAAGVKVVARVPDHSSGCEYPILDENAGRISDPPEVHPAWRIAVDVAGDAASNATLSVVGTIYLGEHEVMYAAFEKVAEMPTGLVAPTTSKGVVFRLDVPYPCVAERLRVRAEALESLGITDVYFSNWCLTDGTLPAAFFGGEGRTIPTTALRPGHRVSATIINTSSVPAKVGVELDVSPENIAQG